MKRRELLKNAMQEDKNVAMAVQLIEKKDKKFLERSLQDLKNQLDDAKESLETRLSSETPIDSSVVEVSYGEILMLESKIEMYESFQSEFITVK